MNAGRRPARFLTAVAVLCTTVWLPTHIEAQTADLVAQGRQALDADRVDDAIAILEKAAADSKDPAALAWLGSAQVRKAGKVPLFERAAWVQRGFTTLDEAVERFPDTFIVYLVRGITAVRVPDLFRKAPVAVKDLSAVVVMREKTPAMVPDSVMPSVYLNLGLAHKKSGQAAEARAAWEKGARLFPSAPESAAMTRELRSL
jgi:hypothetical protein